MPGTFTTGHWTSSNQWLCRLHKPCWTKGFQPTPGTFTTAHLSSMLPTARTCLWQTFLLVCPSLCMFSYVYPAYIVCLWDEWICVSVGKCVLSVCACICVCAHMCVSALCTCVLCVCVCMCVCVCVCLCIVCALIEMCTYTRVQGYLFADDKNVRWNLSGDVPII